MGKYESRDRYLFKEFETLSPTTAKATVLDEETGFTWAGLLRFESKTKEWIIEDGVWIGVEKKVDHHHFGAFTFSVLSEYQYEKRFTNDADKEHAGRYEYTARDYVGGHSYHAREAAYSAMIVAGLNMKYGKKYEDHGSIYSLYAKPE
jgi:hypothetical protein